MKIHVIVEHRTTTPYFSTMIDATVDVCGFLNGTADNVLAKWFMAAISRTFPAEYLHPCPYFGYYVLRNITVEVPKVALQFLAGNYRTTALFFDNQDEMIFKLITKAEFIEVRSGKRKM